MEPRPPPRTILPVSELFHAFGSVGAIGKGVLAVLGVFSVISWTLMFLKIQQMRRAEKGNQIFLADFRKATRLAEVQTAATKAPEP